MHIYRPVLFSIVLVAACDDNSGDATFTGSGLDVGGGDGGGTVSGETVEWDDPAPLIDCVEPEGAALLDEVLDDAHLAYVDLGWTEHEWSEVGNLVDLDDNFLRDGYHDELFSVTTLPCTGAQHAAAVDYALDTRHPLAVLIGQAMDTFSINRKIEPIQPKEASTQEFADLTGIDAGLKAALQPVLAAIAKADYIRTTIAVSAPERSDWLSESYGYLDLSVGPNQVWAVASDGPNSLWDRARALAYAIEDADLDSFVGADGELDLNTDYGRIVISDSSDSEFLNYGEVALWIDLGGDDVYTHPVAVSSDEVPVAVHIDLGGNDTYAGEDGQGSGRFGIGMLFDFSGDDTYTASSMSQGWGHFGVGALVDVEGNDTYASLTTSQGSAAMGLGILLDLAGSDVYETIYAAQGFGYLTGMGMAIDGSGDDVWYANPGTIYGDGAVYVPTCSDDPPYAASACFGTPTINENMSQGASMGYPGLELSGGVGILRDRKGNDDYMASDRAQGFGYWQAAGYLLDGEGSDTYDIAALGQGAGYYMGTGVMLDSGKGDDVFNSRLPLYGMVQGTSSLFAAGIFVNEEGDDTYTWPTCSAGWSSASGVGVFVDNDGSDTYTATYGDSEGYGIGACGGYSVGFAEGGSSYETTTAALFMDSGGDTDTYTGDYDDRDATNDESFGGNTGEWAEKGGAVDGDGETAFHADGT